MPGGKFLFGRQAANQQKPGVTSHEVKGRAPGPRSAEGGTVKSKFRSAAAPALLSTHRGVAWTGGTPLLLEFLELHRHPFAPGSAAQS